MSLRPRHLVLVLVALVTVAACGTSRHASSESAATGQAPASPMGAVSHPPAGPGTDCGKVQSADNVFGTVMVRRGLVDCATMRRVLTTYYADLEAGRAPGNGGGGPVTVQGWRCVSGPATAPGTNCTKSGTQVTVGYR